MKRIHADGAWEWERTGGDDACRELLQQAPTINQYQYRLSSDFVVVKTQECKRAQNNFIIGLLWKNYEVNQFHAPAKVTTAAVLTLFSIHNHVYQKIIDANKIYQCNDYTFKDKN